MEIRLQKKHRRPGGGRKPSLPAQIERAEVLARQLHEATSRGLNVLASEYPGLMELAVQLAKGGVPIIRYTRDNVAFEAVTEPNILMLKTLIELLPKVVGEDRSNDNGPMSELLKNLKANVANIQINVQSPVGSDGSGRNEQTERVTVEGVVRAIPG